MTRLGLHIKSSNALNDEVGHEEIAPFASCIQSVETPFSPRAAAGVVRQIQVPICVSNACILELLSMRGAEWRE
jgi:hypothetical protein